VQNPFSHREKEGPNAKHWEDEGQRLSTSKSREWDSDDEPRHSPAPKIVALAR